MDERTGQRGTAGMAHRKRRMRKRKRQRMIRRMVLILILVLVVILVGRVIAQIAGNRKAQTSAKPQKVVEDPPAYDVELLTVNEYSRPGTAIDPVTGIVVHYTANPGTSAMQNRDYFEGLKDSHITHASSHFVIGIEGELVQCIPCKEISYASNDRNHDTISIECCIADDTGKFSDATYQTLVHLVAWLVGRYDLRVDDVIRHYDVTGKLCPKYYVEHEDAWEQFKRDVSDYIEKNGVEPSE